MTTKRKKINKGFIVLNKGERIAVINLLSIIVIFLGFSIFRPMIRITKDERLAFHRLDSMLAVQDEAIQKSQPQTREKEDKDNQAEKQPSRPPTKQTQVDRKEHLHKQATSSKTTKELPVPIDINHADSTELIALPQIGEIMASRIHRYRYRLGGFVNMEQLMEIKGMDSARYKTIAPYLLLDRNDLRKIDVNRDDFKTLLRHPYLEYEQVKALVNHRERKGLIRNWEQIKEILGDVNPLLEYYMDY